MAGSPLAPIISFVKKYPWQVYASFGPIIYLYMKYKTNSVYANLYSENDFTRALLLEKIKSLTNK
jgi:hypothetical protein